MRKLLLYSLFFFCVLQSCKQPNKELVIRETNTELDLVNGILMYYNQPFNGRLESYYNLGNMKSKVHYKNGKKDGLETLWYKNNLLASKRFYYNGLKTGIHKAWWTNGNLKFVYHFNDKGEYNGNVKEWYESGVLFRDFNYINRKEVGSQRLWYETGKVRANYEVISGERFGLVGLKKCYQVTVNSDEVK